MNQSSSRTDDHGCLLKVPCSRISIRPLQVSTRDSDLIKSLLISSECQLPCRDRILMVENLFFSPKIFLENKKMQEDLDFYARDYEKNPFFSFVSKIYAPNLYNKDVRILSNFWTKEKRGQSCLNMDKREETRCPNNQPLVVARKKRQKALTNLTPRTLSSWPLPLEFSHTYLFSFLASKPEHLIP